MNLLSRFTAVALSLALGAVALPAHADDEDKAACADKDEGDACTRGDGGPGTCIQDDSDSVLSCDDDAPSDDDGSDGCSASPRSRGGAGAALVGLVALGLCARRRRP